MKIPFLNASVKFERPKKVVRKQPPNKRPAQKPRKKPLPNPKVSVDQLLTPAEKNIMVELLVRAGLSSVDTTAQQPLPVKGGRSSISDSATSGLLSALAVISPDVPFEFLEIMESLSKWNADFSYAVDNIIQLSNTKYTVTFDDSVSDDQAKLMNMSLKQASKRWYNQSEGIMSLNSDLLAQLAITGALSAEIVPNMSLTGVEKAVIVNPKGVRFKYDPDLDQYMPYQILKGIITEIDPTTGMHPLNPVTYKYLGLRRLNDKPYAIPPLLSALENVAVEKDMMAGIKTIVKKLGILGFLSVLVTPPMRLMQETPEAYQSRCGSYLDSVIPQMEKGLSKGYVAGFKDTHEFKLESVMGNIQDAKGLFDLNAQSKFAGLKQDPLMLGRNFSTTETLGRVILAKLTTQIAGYQYKLKEFLEALFTMHCMMQGFAFNYLEVEFEPAMIGDKLRDAQTFQAVLLNLEVLYQQGIISQDQYAIEAGYEQPDQPEPRVPAGFGLNPKTGLPDPVPADPNNPLPKPPKPDGKGDDPTNPKTTAVKSQIKAALIKSALAELETELGGDFPEYVYKVDHGDHSH